MEKKIGWGESDQCLFLNDVGFLCRRALQKNIAQACRFKPLLKSIYFAPRERSQVNLETRIVPSRRGCFRVLLVGVLLAGARDLPESAVPARDARRDVRGRAPLEPFLNATTSTAVTQRPFIGNHVL